MTDIYSPALDALRDRAARVDRSITRYDHSSDSQVLDALRTAVAGLAAAAREAHGVGTASAALAHVETALRCQACGGTGRSATDPTDGCDECEGGTR